MKTLAEIKDQLAQEWDCDNWQDLKDYHKREVGHPITDDMYDVVARRYAKAMIEADRKDCAEKTDPAKFFEGDTRAASITTILDRPYPPME